MKTQRNYNVYALTAGRYAYVGKTYGENLRPTLWRHMRGENRYTRQFFSRGLPCKPKMYVLANVKADSSAAYRYELAVIRILLDEGFHVLNSAGMMEDAADLHESTERILQNLKKIPLRERMEIGDIDYLEKESKANEAKARKKKGQKAEKELATEKITMRVTPEEKRLFEAYVKEMGVTQRQALQLLLLNRRYDDLWDADLRADVFVRNLLKAYREENAKMEKEIWELKEEIKKLKKQRNDELKEREAGMRRGIVAFFQFFESANPSNPALEQGVHRVITQGLRVEERHHYPDQEGFFMFYPKKILLGKGRYPLFIVGENEEGHKICLRFYPKNYYTGLRFTNKSFGLKNSAWLVGVERARDEAMDVIFALPLNIRLRRADIIDDLIQNAENQLEYDDWFV